MRALAEAPQLLMHYADIEYNYIMSWDYYDKEWQEDRRKLFAEGGNGWWRLLGTPLFREHMKKIKEAREKDGN